MNITKTDEGYVAKGWIKLEDGVISGSLIQSKPMPTRAEAFDLWVIEARLVAERADNYDEESCIS